MAKKTKKKRTISPEHLKKMQKGKKNKKIMEQRLRDMEDRGLLKSEPVGYTQSILNKIKKKK